jgi:hypothetical protein
MISTQLMIEKKEGENERETNSKSQNRNLITRIQFDLAVERKRRHGFAEKDMVLDVVVDDCCAKIQERLGGGEGKMAKSASSCPISNHVSVVTPHFCGMYIFIWSQQKEIDFRWDI